MEPIVIKLTVPLTHGAETSPELRITRRPTAGDLRGVKISELTFDDIITVASRLVALPPSVLNTMDRALRRYRRFFREWPADWDDALTLLAWLYHWPPSELERMTARDLAWWAERTKKLQKLMEHD